MDIEEVFARRCPGECSSIEQSRVSGEGIGQHKRSVEEKTLWASPIVLGKGPNPPKSGGGATAVQVLASGSYMAPLSVQTGVI